MTKFNNDHQQQRAYQNVRPFDADQSLQRVSALFTAMSAIAAVREESPIILGETLELQNDIAVLREMFDAEMDSIIQGQANEAKSEADQIEQIKAENLERVKRETKSTVRKFKNQQKKIKAILSS